MQQRLTIRVGSGIAPVVNLIRRQYFSREVIQLLLGEFIL